MDKKFLIIAAGICIALASILAVQLVLQGNSTVEQIADAERNPFAAVKSEQVAKISIRCAGSAFTLKKIELEGSVYFAIVEKDNYPADGIVVDKLLDSLVNIILVRKHRGSDRLANACGLDKAEAIEVSLTDKAGKSLAKLRIGKKSGLGRFVQVGDDDAIFASKENVRAPVEFAKLAALDFPKLDPDEIESIEFSFPREKSTTYTMKRGEPGLPLEFEGKDVEAENLSGIIAFLKEFSVANLCDISYEKSGLDNPVQVVEFHLKGGSHAIVSIGNVLPVEKRQIARRRYVAIDFKLGKDFPDGMKTRYVNFKKRCGKHVWLLKDSREFSLMNFRVPVLKKAAPQELTQIELKRKEQSVLLEKREKQWLVGGDYDFPADGDRVDSLISSLEKIKSRPGDIANEGVDIENYSDLEKGNTRYTLKGSSETSLVMGKERKADGSLFVKGDFKDFPEMVAKLCDPVNPVSRVVLQKLSEKLQKQLRDFRMSIPYGSLEKDLLEEFNKLIKGKSLYKEGVFNEASLREETMKLAQGRQWETQRLNRLLLEDAYPHDIVKSEKYLVDDIAEVSDSWGNYYLKPSGKLTFGSSGPSWFPLNPREWLHNKVLKISESDISGMELEIAGKKLSWVNKDDKLEITTPPPGFKNSNELISTLESLTIADVVKKSDTKTDSFASAKESLRLTVTGKKGLRVTVVLRGTDPLGYRFGKISAEAIAVEQEQSKEGEAQKNAIDEDAKKQAREIENRFKDRIVKFDIRTTDSLFAIPVKRKSHKEESLRSITLKKGDVLIELAREGNDWKIGKEYANREMIVELLKQIDDLDLRYGNITESGATDEAKLTIIGDKTDVYEFSAPFDPQGKDGYLKYRFFSENGDRYLVRDDAVKLETDASKWVDKRVLRLLSEQLSTIEFKSPDVHYNFVVKDGKIQFADLPKDHVMLSPLEESLDSFLREMTRDKLDDVPEKLKLSEKMTLGLKNGDKIELQFSKPNKGKVWVSIIPPKSSMEGELESLLKGKMAKVASQNLSGFSKKRDSLESLQVQTSHILVSWKGAERSKVDRSEQEARKIIEEVKKKLQQPEADFAALACEYSDEPGAKESKGVFPTPIDANTFGVADEYKQAALKLEKVGDTSDIVKTRFGFHIIRRDK